METRPKSLSVAVVGHVEWVSFLELDRVPRAGEIVHTRLGFEEPAGGGGVAAVELARIFGGATLFTVLGDDDTGHRCADLLAQKGVDVRARWTRQPQRRAVTMLDAQGERTILVVGGGAASGQDAPAVPEGADLTAVVQFDAVYFCKGDASAARAARQARVMVATARVLPVLQAAGVELDALVHSVRDAGERYTPGELSVVPRLVAATEGSAGGAFDTADGRVGRWEAAPLPGRLRDTYGAGDCFAAGLTAALAQGFDAQLALEFAAARGATALCRRGAHGGS